MSEPQAVELSPEDKKLVTLARATRALASCTAMEPDAVRVGRAGAARTTGAVRITGLRGWCSGPVIASSMRPVSSGNRARVGR